VTGRQTTLQNFASSASKFCKRQKDRLSGDDAPKAANRSFFAGFPPRIRPKTFIKNANVPGNIWENNGPRVSDKIRVAAGLEASFRDLLSEENP
jgi:hypothetical protein